MRTRIDSSGRRRMSLRRRTRATTAVAIVAGLIGTGLIGTGHGRAEIPGYFTDPTTGQVFQKVTRIVERPEVTTTTESREQTVYTPKTVTETRPYSRTVYTPVTEFRWEPRLHNRWNPFAPPTVVYHHVPSTHWEARNEVIQRTTAQTEWVAENRTIQVPVTQRRIVREERVEMEPVGKLAPQQASPPGSSMNAVASRLRPLSDHDRVIPTTSQLPPSLYASDSNRTPLQSGHRPTNLVPSLDAVYGTPMTPAGTIATPFQPVTIFR